jgi:hypothetical protein
MQHRMLRKSRNCLVLQTSESQVHVAQNAVKAVLLRYHWSVDASLECFIVSLRFTHLWQHNLLQD